MAWSLARTGEPGRGKFRTTTIGLVLISAVMATASEPVWPPFLPSADHFSADTVERVERVWRDLTLTRTVRAEPAAAPFATYVALVDLPDVTTAAARHLKLAKYEVKALADDFYEAQDHVSARGRYRVLVRTPHRRVLLSWGEHRGRLLGTIAGSALTIVDFEPAGDRVEHMLETHVLIENRVAARVARLLVPIFGGIADRRLTEALAVTGKVAEWATSRPKEFCEWLTGEPLTAERRERALPLFARCRTPREAAK